MGTVHFTIGDNFGDMLTNIAQEKLIYDYNLTGAIKTIKDSLIGIDEVTAFKILVGILDLDTDTATQTLGCITGKAPYSKLKLDKLESLTVNITDGYNAGWLSQDGTYYGMNGELANMLHIELANLMVEAGIIPDDFGGETCADSWLSKNGWVKQHDNWILYDGYYNNMLGYTDIPISAKQIHEIYKLGQIVHNGVLKLGLSQERVSAALFQMIDPLQFKLKWFKF